MPSAIVVGAIIAVDSRFPASAGTSSAGMTYRRGPVRPRALTRSHIGELGITRSKAIE